MFGKTTEIKRRSRKKKKSVTHKSHSNQTAQYNHTQTNGATGANIDSAANHVVHPTVVRTNLPFKRKVNEVRRAATKAKRAAKSQLGRPHKKSGTRREAVVISPTESEKSMAAALGTEPIPTTKYKEKDRLSSRFSIISFKTFRPKSISPDKYKIKVSDKRKGKGSNDKKIKSKSSKDYQNRSRSPDKKRRSMHECNGLENHEKSRKSRSPSKRISIGDDKHRSRHHSSSPDKIRRQSSPDKNYRHRQKSPEKLRKMSEGNWLINKFLADEEKICKPIINGSLAGSLCGSVSSANGPLTNQLSGGSPLTGHARHGSARALLDDARRSSPVRGIVNEAFISSPRGARTHSSLRVTKSVSPEGLDFDLGPNKYRRSISMEAYNRPPSSPDKRKRSVMDEGANLDKKRRFSSPEKHGRKVSPVRELQSHSADLLQNAISLSETERRRSSISSPSSKTNSYSSVPEKIREKLSLITASNHGSVASIVNPTDTVDALSNHSSNCRSSVKDWV